MTCIHCGGNHYSDYCTGYNSSSMNESLSEISSGIDSLSEFNERALDEISDKYSDMLDAQDRIVESNDRIAGDITRAGLDVSDAVNASSIVNAKGYEHIGKSINEAGNKAFIGSIVAGQMISSALIGIGAILQYRERMEQLRHKERMSFKEENSNAGKARRELKTASSILFAGDPTQAATHLKKSLTLFPSSAETFRLRSIIESKQEKHNEAIVSLKTALKLAEGNHLFPSLQNIDGSITDELYEKVITSSLTQLSQEFAITGQLNHAIKYLSNGVDEFPNNSDLLFQRVRVLSKTNLWERNFEEYISAIVGLSPKHFNILYSDLQLKRKEKQVQTYLKSIKSEKIIQLQNKQQALTTLSEGASEQLTAFNTQPRIEDFSFVSIVNLTDTLTKEIKEQTNK
jgi:tetratricopeptide (TPR) repeat protein